jgi:hypothetical protein
MPQQGRGCQDAGENQKENFAHGRTPAEETPGELAPNLAKQIIHPDTSGKTFIWSQNY